MDLLDMLTSFGLTRQEAAIYLTLCQEGSLTGYEAAKHTGVSRSNAYTALAGLVDKGAAYVSEGKATHYLPVPVREFCENKIRRLSRMAGHLARTVPGRASLAAGYITIKGRDHILDQAGQMIRQAQKRVYLCAGDAAVQHLEGDLAEAAQTGRKIVVIAASPVSVPGAKLYLSCVPAGQIRLIADSSRVLTGDIADSQSTCLYSEKQNLADLIKDTIKNEIKLIKLEQDKKTKTERTY